MDALQRPAARVLLPAILRELKEEDTSHVVFHGSWDWHSACHGHWAALRAADLLGDRETLSWIRERLSGEGLREEVDTLLREPEFERPYGRAWFLRLMLAYQEVTGDETMVEVVQPVADHLLLWLQGETLSPDVGEYANPCWALLQLHAWANARGDANALSWIRGVTQRSLLCPGVSVAADHEGPGEFFSRWGLHAMVLGNVLGRVVLRDWLQDEGADPSALRPIDEPLSAHHLGVNASRAWGLWSAYLATGEEPWRQAYEDHVQASLGLHPEWEHDRRAYTHWVPQFTMYAALRPQQEPLRRVDSDASPRPRRVRVARGKSSTE